MKNLILMLLAVGYIVSMTSCSTQENCWAYRDVSKYQYNNSKHRPSVAISKGRKKMKLRSW
jgi:hypothetical protein